MSEFDAFGRPIAKDSGSSSPSTPTPIQSPTGFGPASTPRRARGTRMGCAVALALLLLTVGVPIAIGVLAFSQVSDTINSVTRSLSRSFTTSSSSFTTSTSPAPPEPPTDLSHESMLRRANLAPALREIRRLANGSTPTFVRVEALRVDVQTIGRDGTIRNLQRPWDAKATVLSTSPGGPRSAGLRWSQINAAAPQRMSEAVRNGSTRAANQLTYAVLLAATKTWSAFRSDGTLYTAGLSGRNAHRLGG